MSSTSSAATRNINSFSSLVLREVDGPAVMAAWLVSETRSTLLSVVLLWPLLPGMLIAERGGGEGVEDILFLLWFRWQDLFRIEVSLFLINAFVGVVICVVNRSQDTGKRGTLFFGFSLFFLSSSLLFRSTDLQSQSEYNEDTDVNV